MLNNQQLKTFIRVYETGSLTKAADELNVSIQAVSQQMAKLETAVGSGLYNASTRAINFTPMGKQFYPKAVAVIQQADNLAKWVNLQQKEPRGVIRVIYQNTDIYRFTILPFLKEFSVKYPKLSLQITIHEQLIDAEKDTADVYWGVGEYVGYNHQSLKRSSILKSRYGVFASPEYLETNGTPICLEDLRDHTVIGSTNSKPSSALFLQTNGQESSVIKSQQVKSQLTVSCNPEELGAQGLGLFNGSPKHPVIRQYLEEGKLMPVLEEFWYDEVDIYVYFQNTRLPQAGVKEFIDFFTAKREQWAIY